MAKRKKNYPDPRNVFDKYGADSIRSNARKTISWVLVVPCLVIDQALHLLNMCIVLIVQWPCVTWVLSQGISPLAVALIREICVLFRLYLINSPVVRADNLRFKEEGVRDVVKDVFLPWFNAYRFLMQNVERLQRVLRDTDVPKLMAYDFVKIAQDEFSLIQTILLKVLFVVF